MNIEKLIEDMRHGVVTFSYRKKDGSIRSAVGTLCEDYFSYERKGSESSRPAGLVSYWDMEAGGWRCFREENLL